MLGKAMPSWDFPPRCRGRVWSSILVATIVLACFTVSAEASRDEQDDRGPEPFSEVRDTIQQKLAKAANKLVESSEAQAALTRSVSDNIGEYKGKVQKIAETIGDVLKARQDLTQAYRDDISRGEEARISALQVDIPELSRGDNAELQATDGFSSETQGEESGLDYGLLGSSSDEENIASQDDSKDGQTNAVADSQDGTSDDRDSTDSAPVSDNDAETGDAQADEAGTLADGEQPLVQEDHGSQENSNVDSNEGPGSDDEDIEGLDSDAQSERSDPDFSGEDSNDESSDDLPSNMQGIDAALLEVGRDVSPQAPPSSLLGLEEIADRSSQAAASRPKPVGGWSTDGAEDIAIGLELSSMKDSRAEDVLSVQPDNQQTSGASSLLSREEHYSRVDDEGWLAEEISRLKRRDSQLHNSKARPPLHSSAVHTARPLLKPSQSGHHHKAARPLTLSATTSRQQHPHQQRWHPRRMAGPTHSHQEQRHQQRNRLFPELSMLQKSRQKVTLHDRAARVQSWAGLAARRLRQKQIAGSRHHLSELQDRKRQLRDVRHEAFRDHAHPAVRATSAHLTPPGHHRHMEVQPRSFRYQHH